MQNQAELNRTIWIFWKQGFENAPEVVRICLRSWKVNNPGWRVVELSDANLDEYIDLESLGKLRGLKNIIVVKFANLMRLYLLSRHGGVWADATCFCARPLDEWLPDYMASGFFAFRRHPDAWLRDPRNAGLRGYLRRSGDRIFASWFLASLPGNALATKFFESHLGFFAANSFSLRGTPKAARRIKALARVLNRNVKLVQWWTHPLVTRTFNVYPYFILHYQFAWLVSHDAACRDVWNRTPVFLIRNLSRLLTSSVVSPMTDELLRELNRPTAYMHKLTWKYRQEDFKEGCVLDYLARSLG